MSPELSRYSSGDATGILDTTHLVKYGEGGDDEDGVDAIHD